MIDNKCYKSRSSEYSKETCINIGGSYTAEPVYPNRRYCFYTNDHCRLHAVNEQCYSRSSNHSQTACKTIPHSYYDDSSRTCYYYCTDVPTLGRCFVGNNSSFSTDMCSLIGGVNAHDTCYYVSLNCPAYSTSNGLCYSNRSAALTCGTCRNIGGHFENGFCHYHQKNCSGYRVDGQCYSNRTARFYSTSCRNMGGIDRGGYCYYDQTACRYYRNCTCFRYNSGSKTAATCKNIGGYYDTTYRQCYYNSATCPYYRTYSQCYKYKNENLTSSTCSIIGGIRTYATDPRGRYVRACYYNNFNCSNWIDNVCYLRFTTSYNLATCSVIGGYYSQDEQACYYNSTTCNYWMGGQCYYRYYYRWSRIECEKVHGYYYQSYYSSSKCYISSYHCPYVWSANKICYRYLSTSLDCNSCQTIGGWFQSGRCYHFDNCSQPLLLASNGQCYKNQTAVRTAAECSAVIGSSFYDQTAGKCYFTSGHCSSGYYANCKCFVHSSTIYTAGSCKNFGGEYVNGVCYYNSSYCRQYSVNGQCYVRYTLYNSEQLCRNIGGHFVPFNFAQPMTTTTTTRWYRTYPNPMTTSLLYQPTSSPIFAMRLTTTPFTTTTVTGRRPTSSSGKCYYNNINCSAFLIDRYYCYSNVSAIYGRTTCRNIGGRYGYWISNSTYQSSYLSWKKYYCLFNAFDCAG